MIINEKLCQYNTDREEVEKGYHALACVIWFKSGMIEMGVEEAEMAAKVAVDVAVEESANGIVNVTDMSISLTERIVEIGKKEKKWCMIVDFQKEIIGFGIEQVES